MLYVLNTSRNLVIAWNGRAPEAAKGRTLVRETPLKR